MDNTSEVYGIYVVITVLPSDSVTAKPFEKSDRPDSGGTWKHMAPSSLVMYQRSLHHMLKPSRFEWTNWPSRHQKSSTHVVIARVGCSLAGWLVSHPGWITWRFSGWRMDCALQTSTVPWLHWVLHGFSSQHALPSCPLRLAKRVLHVESA